MPQMNPMNWLILLVMFSGLVYLNMVKIHFMMKTNKEVNSVKDFNKDLSIGMKLVV